MAVKLAPSVLGIPDMVVFAVAEARVEVDLYCVVECLAVDDAFFECLVERITLDTNTLVVPFLAGGVLLL